MAGVLEETSFRGSELEVDAAVIIIIPGGVFIVSDHHQGSRSATRLPRSSSVPELRGRPVPRCDGARAEGSMCAGRVSFALPRIEGAPK